MKKYYVMLFSITSVIISGILITKQAIVQSSTVVTLYPIQTKQVEDTVTCTGTIASADSEEVYVDYSCIAGTVNVKAGDSVNKGDELFTIDVDATKQVLASVKGVSPSLISDAQITDTVTAPISGIVSTINVAEGEAVDSDTPCVVIATSDALEVQIAIYEKNVKNIAIGQTAIVSGTAFSKDSYSGTVSYISSSARKKYSGTTVETVVDAVITLNETDDSLKPGLSAKTKIQISVTPDCIIVPYEYVLQDDDNQEYVYLYKNGRAMMQIVETGKEYSEGFEIISGLSTGDKIIKNPEDIKNSGEMVTVE